jgi:CheY-like chemotaxis protein
MLKAKPPIPYLSATNGLEAVEAYKNSTPHKPRIILMDISMPIMDGLTATREIRKFEANSVNSVDASLINDRAIIVALTGLADQGTRVEAERAGMDQFLVKPVKFKELRGVLDGSGK